MTAPAFDPCKQWLGIDAVDLGDPRRVLGLPPGLVDAQAITRAAAIKFSLLQSVAPGPFAMAHAALLRRVAEARDTLLAEAAAAAGPTFRMPPPPSTGRPPVPPPIPAAPPPPGNRPISPMESDAFAGLQQQQSQEPVIAVRPRSVPNYKPRSSVGPLLLLVVAGLSAVAGVMGYQAIQAKSGKTRDKNRETSSVNATEGQDTGRRKVALGSGPPEHQKAGHAERPTKKELPGTPATQRIDDAPAEDMAADDTPATDPPAPTPPAADPEVERLLSEAFGLMQKQEFDAAAESLAMAHEATSDDDLEDRIISFEELQDCAKKFFSYRAQALADVRPGVEYEVPTATSKRVIAIVEINDEQLIFKEAGKVSRVERDKIPAALLTHIVREWFDEKAENHLFLGAYFATKPEPDLAKAREEWTTAQVEGADATGLIPLLDDPILTASPE